VQSLTFDDEKPADDAATLVIPLTLDDQGGFAWGRYTAPSAGPHTATLRFGIQPSMSPKGIGPVYTASVMVHFETVPKSESTLKMIKEPSFQAGLRKSIHFDTITMSPGFVKNSELLSEIVYITDPPCPFGFEVYLRDGNGKEWRIGEIGMNPPKKPGQFVMNILTISITGFTGSSADIILRSSPEVARNTPDVTEFWDGEIVFKDVAISWRNGGNGSK